VQDPEACVALMVKMAGPAVEGTTAASRQHRHRNNILGAPVAGQEWLAPEWLNGPPLTSPEPVLTVRPEA